MIAATFALTLPVLFKFWWKNGFKTQSEQSVAWAVTITWTLVLNLYVGIYDSTLVVLSLLLTTDVIYRRAAIKQMKLQASYKLIVLLVYVVPWITQPIARLTHIQIYTLVLAFLGIWQLRQSGRSGSVSPQMSDNL